MTAILVAVAAVIVFVVLLAAAERALKAVTRRHLDRRRRVIRALVFLGGMAAWTLLSYGQLQRFGEWWLAAFLIVAGIWKLVVDIFVFGERDRTGSDEPRA